MLGRVGFAFLWAFGGYVAGALVTYLLIAKLSSNQHDRSTEAGMTGCFVGGPIVAIVAFIVAFIQRSP